MLVQYHGKTRDLTRLKRQMRRWGGSMTTREDIEDAMQDIVVGILESGNTDVSATLSRAIQRYTQTAERRRTQSLDALVAKAPNMRELIDDADPSLTAESRDCLDEVVATLAEVRRWPDRRYAAWILLWLRDGCSPAAWRRFGQELGAKTERARRQLQEDAQAWWRDSWVRGKTQKNYGQLD